MGSQRWSSLGFYYPEKNSTGMSFEGPVNSGQYLIDNLPGPCPSFRDPRDDVISSLNELLVYTGAILGTDGHLYNFDGRVDPGLSFNSKVTGYIEGSQNEFHTNYWFFLAAAIVELVCIALVAPT